MWTLILNLLKKSLPDHYPALNILLDSSVASCRAPTISMAVLTILIGALGRIGSYKHFQFSALKETSVLSLDMRNGCILELPY